MDASPLRIAHLLLTRRFAGSERYAVELAGAQAESGHEVHVVLRRAATLDRPDAIAQRLPPAVRLHVVGDLLAPWRARRLLSRLRPDVAHAHLSGGCRALHGVAAPVARVATLHIRYKPRQHAALDGLVAIAPWQLQAIPPALRARTVQIDNWTLPAAPRPGARAALRRAHGIAEDAFLFGTLGRVERSKGHDLLVDAFARAGIAGARLAIVGGGNAFGAVRARAGTEVVMPGFSDDPAGWLSAFDCFVSAARSEPFGLVFLEAMQARLPMLATATQGASYLAPWFDAPLVPVDDAGALAAALRATAAARPARRDYDLARFRLPPRIAEFDAFYREVGRHRRERATA